MPAKANRGRSSFDANHTTPFFPVEGLGSGAYSAKLLAGTKQRLSGFSPDLARKIKALSVPGLVPASSIGILTSHLVGKNGRIAFEGA
jgi:hypothetical protein